MSEGNKYYIRNVSWVGNSVYETEGLQQMFGVKKGDIYDKKTMHKQLGIGKETDPEATSVSSLYQNEGYLMSQIEPAETIIAPDSIDIEVKVFEGKQFTINEVGITGNQRVDDEVIRRELDTRPGELYNRALLMRTIRLLGSMGHFNPEAIMPDIKPVSNELVNINWPLEEQASDQFNIAGGWGSGTFVGSVGITLNNLSIKNTFKKGAWRPTRWARTSGSRSRRRPTVRITRPSRSVSPTPGWAARNPTRSPSRHTSRSRTTPITYGRPVRSISGPTASPPVWASV